MTIVLLVDGETERAFKEILKRFLDHRAEQESQPRVRLVAKPLSKASGADDLRKRVEMSLRSDISAVFVLRDVYPNFESGEDAVKWMRESLGNLAKDERVRLHAAQYEFEAWLLPYWDKILRRVNRNQKPWGANPEKIDLQNPPSKRLEELYRMAKPRPKSYKKPSEALAILDGEDLTVAADRCPRLKALLNDLLGLCGLSAIP